MVAIITSGVVFMHKEVTSTGEIVTHIHPYDFTQKGEPQHHHSYDLAILISRDADFAGVVRIIKNLGKNVELVLFEAESGNAEELTDTVDSVVLLTTADCARCEKK